ncbi:MAG: nuclear transport factor 2 family protein [Proteobacteria bacterium]|nr:nuclear transport factor 2 family protein [Pseudomonadota bacterium]
MSLSRRHLAATGAFGAGLALVAAATGPAQAAADEASVAAAVEAYRKAILAKDKAALEALCAPQVSYGHSSGVIQNRDEFVTGTVNSKSVTKALEFSKIWNAVVGDNAISRFIWDSESETEGKTTQTHIGVLIVWVQQGGAWKILGRQAYKL